MALTELDKAVLNAERIKELTVQIEQLREFKLSEKKAKDDILCQTWDNQIKILTAEREALNQTNRYQKLYLFTQCAKAYLTPQQFKDCWDRVDQVLEHPELMKSRWMIT